MAVKAVIVASPRSAAMTRTPSTTVRNPIGEPAPVSRGGASYRSVAASTAASADAAAAAAKTAAGPLTCSSNAAASGPINIATESSNPLPTFALVSSSGVMQSDGRRAECAGRKSVCATVAATSAAYTTVTGPPPMLVAAAMPSVRARTPPTHARTTSRRTRSANGAANGATMAAGIIRATPTRPTAATPPCRKATTPSATAAAHSPAQMIPNASCARLRVGLRRLTAHALAALATQLPIRTSMLRV